MCCTNNFGWKRREGNVANVKDLMRGVRCLLECTLPMLSMLQTSNIALFPKTIQEMGLPREWGKSRDSDVMKDLRG